ncbi:MAG: ytbE [Myxococcales bacterium]|nr:ytbE [Myxococcales bacterium]
MTTIDVRGIRVPAFLYGTAWKEDATEPLVFGALAAGFRGIDTANQRKHYHEAGVGAALARKVGALRRDELFIQTKFTFQDGQDHRLPYDPEAPIAAQVAQSFQSSLEHLGVDKIDSLVLHGPSQREGLGADDHEAWRAMEALAVSGRVALLGISNATARQVSELVAFARVAPAFVQNRCYAERAWDGPVRELCADHGMVYQGFSLLTANRQVLDHPGVRAIAKQHGKTPAQVVFRFSRQVGMLPLTGTKDPAHMKQDLAIEDFELTAPQVATVMDAGRR